jgi:hypothetical protein
MKTKVMRIALSLALIAGLGLSVAVATITQGVFAKSTLVKVSNGKLKAAERGKEVLSTTIGP